MKTIPRFALTLASGIALALPFASRAADLGDPAAPLHIANWIKGNSVDLAAAKGKQIVVVEFWATWCPPCRASIPHLTELQKKFKDRDVVFVGISDEKLAKVKPFVKKMGDQMNYVVALDDQRKTSEGYMRAYNQNGIPHAFIVDKQSRVVWHGHPMADLETTLDQLLAGKYDLAMAKKRSRARELYQEFFELAAKDEHTEKIESLTKELTRLDKEIGGINPGTKFDPDQIRRQARFQSALREYQTGLARGKSEADLADLEQSVRKNAPDEFDLDEFKQSFKFQRAYIAYYRAATGRGDDSELPDLGAKLLAAKPKDAQMLNDVAWSLLTDERLKHRDHKLALKLAQAAYDACDGKVANVVDTYARALFDSGKTQEAIRYQKKAISLCEDQEKNKEKAADFKKTLSEYEAKAGSGQH